MTEGFQPDERIVEMLRGYAVKWHRARGTERVKVDHDACAAIDFLCPREHFQDYVSEYRRLKGG
jgi:hypothetical protein